MAIAMLIAITVAGCGQDADGRAWWEPRQGTLTSEDAQQKQTTLGGHDAAPIYVWQTGGSPEQVKLPLGEGFPDEGPVENVKVDGDGVEVGRLPARYVQFVDITYSQSATTTPSGSVTQGATTTPTVQGDVSTATSPDQRTDPAVTTPVAVGLPGSAPSAIGSGGTGGATVDQAATVENQLTTRLAELAATDPNRFADLLGAIFATPDVTSNGSP